MKAKLHAFYTGHRMEASGLLHVPAALLAKKNLFHAFTSKKETNWSEYCSEE
jgi:hypothetical protein